MPRTPAHDIDPLFIERWSPRAMSGAPLKEQDLSALLEAARWAPSSGNFQPWKFLYARAGTPQFQEFFELLLEGNRVWCQRAGALFVVLSRRSADGEPVKTHSFDTGAAWMSLALQGTRLGLVVHGMAGFDYDAARARLGIPEDHAVEAMIAVGYPGRVEDLPARLQAREKPSDRNPVETFAFEGHFPK